MSGQWRYECRCGAVGVIVPTGTAATDALSRHWTSDCPVESGHWQLRELSTGHREGSRHFDCHCRQCVPAGEPTDLLDLLAASC